MGEQLQMSVCLESFHAGLHPQSLYSQKLTKKKTSSSVSEKERNKKYSYTTLSEIQDSTSITPNISLLECARRADGAACLILASNRFLKRRNLWMRKKDRRIVIIGGGQSSGPLYPPKNITEYTYASCQQAMDQAYANAGNLTANDIQFFGLYDCFPICLIRAIEACGLLSSSSYEHGGEYLQHQYERLIKAINTSTVESLLSDPTFFPINTHGGLLCYGAPWEVPAMFNVVEAVEQLSGRPKGRRIENCNRALVYGNGGILSSSAVAILANTF